MEPRSNGPDPRRRLLLGLPLLFALGLLVRTAIGTPPGAGWQINRAIEASVRGDREMAYRMLNDVVVARPDDADVWMRTGVLLQRMGRPFESAVYCRKAAELDSTSSSVQIECIKSLILAGFPDQAQERVDAFLAHDPNDGGVLYLAAALAAGRGDAKEAAELYRRAVAFGAWRPDRFRHDRTFDPVRNAPVFLQAIYDTRLPGSFREDAS